MAKKQKFEPNPLEIFYKDNKFIPDNPRPQEFYVGQVVEIGNLDYARIIEVVDETRGFYRIEYRHTENNYGNPREVSGTRLVNWTDVGALPTLAVSVFAPDTDIRVENQQRDVEGLIRTVHYFGVDFESEFQRGYVWNPNDKVSLILSVFTGIDIGKFTFIKNDWDSKFLYQVLDGKQRLSTLVEFFEGRFDVSGVYFNDLSRTDKSKFLSTPVSLGIIPQGASRLQILRAFYKLNFCGKTMGVDHLTKIIEMIKEEEGEQ